MTGLTEGEQNRLIQENVGLVGPIAAEYREHRSIPYEDIESEGMLGLVRAARGWQQRGKFPAYADKMIRGTILNFVRDWQEVEVLPAGYELEERVHEWQMWGGFPYEGWTALPTSPEELLEIYQDVEAAPALIENALRDLKPRSRRMITAHFLRTPAVKLEQIARDEKISYYRCVEIVYDAMKKLRDNVLAQLKNNEERRDNVIPFRSAPRKVVNAGVRFAV